MAARNVLSAWLAALLIAMVVAGPTSADDPMDEPPPPPPPGGIDDRAYTSTVTNGGKTADYFSGLNERLRLPSKTLWTLSGASLLSNRKPQYLAGLTYSNILTGIDLTGEGLAGDFEGYGLNARLDLTPARRQWVSTLRRLYNGERWQGDTDELLREFEGFALDLRLGVFGGYRRISEYGEFFSGGVSLSQIHPLSSGTTSQAPPGVFWLVAVQPIHVAPADTTQVRVTTTLAYQDKVPQIETLPFTYVRSRTGSGTYTNPPAGNPAYPVVPVTPLPSYESDRVTVQKAHIARWRWRLGVEVSNKAAYDEAVPVSGFVTYRLEPKRYEGYGDSLERYYRNFVELRISGGRAGNDEGYVSFQITKPF